MPNLSSEALPRDTTVLFLPSLSITVVFYTAACPSSTFLVFKTRLSSSQVPALVSVRYVTFLQGILNFVQSSAVYTGYCSPFRQGLRSRIRISIHEWLIFALQAGANVILSARRTDALQKVTEACVAAHKESGLKTGGKFAALALDVGDKEQVDTFLERIPADLKQIDILGMSTIFYSCIRS